MIFNAEEIFQMAIQIERNGVEFYSKASQVVKNEKVRHVLEFLAQSEVEHEKIFSRMKEQFLEQHAVLEQFDPDGDTARYLQAMASGHIFDLTNDPAESMTGNETERDVLMEALKREKDSIVFYMGMKDMVTQSVGKDHVERIIKEEMRHVNIISKYLS